MTTLNSNTPVLVVEINPHLQTSTTWLGCMTVGDVISVVNQKTAFSTTQPQEFLLKNAGKTLEDFTDADGDFDGNACLDWENSQSTEAHFDAAIDCESSDGHIIRVYFTQDEALNDGAPRYMSEEQYEQAVNLVFGE